jgi:hypothetical protein
MVDLTDPDVTLTWQQYGQLTSQQRRRRDERHRERLIAWPDDLYDAAEAHIDDVGLEAAIAELAAWIRLVLKDPKTTVAAPLLAPRMIDRWRACGENIAPELTRYAAAADYAREVIRDELGLRRFKKPPEVLDDFEAQELYAAAHVTVDHLAELPNVSRRPPRRPRRRRQAPAPPASRPPVDLAQRERDREAYAREQRECEQRQHDERISRITGDDSTRPGEHRRDARLDG